jgi:polyhydroxybutyrate depolymerase
LERITLDDLSPKRTAWLARNGEAPGPLLIACHGLGMNGRNMASWTGFAQHGPECGFSVVFPDALGQVWDPANLAARPGDADPAFLRALVARLAETGVADPKRVVLVGVSNGAQFAESIGRNAELELAGLVLVIGTTLTVTREATPLPLRATPLLCFEGTADRQMPYAGGPMRASSLTGRIAARKYRRVGIDPRVRVTVGVDALLEDWCAVNGQEGEPSTESIPDEAPAISVTRCSWREPGQPPVVLYRVEGGGHLWPGAGQLIPAAFVGRSARSLDTSCLTLAFATEALIDRTS